MRRVLVTGAGGFIGAHVVEHLLENTDWHIVATDSFRHKGKTDRLRNVIETATGAVKPGQRRARLHVITHDLSAPISSQMASTMGAVDYVLALASESHVDRSIDDPANFARNNFEVALSTLEYCRTYRPRHLIWTSTDEVYGPIQGNHDHKEWAPILPSNPYSGSKAAQEAMAISYWRTYDIPLTIVNCMNLIGERQDPEKFLPMLIGKINNGETVPIHGTPEDIGSRHYLHARNLADAMIFLLQEDPPSWTASPVWGSGSQAPARYNIVGPDRVSNLELAQRVAAIIDKPLDYELIDFHSTRPGHDAHYGLDSAKLTEKGWKPPIPFDESLERTVKWTLGHPEWMS